MNLPGRSTLFPAKSIPWFVAALLLFLLWDAGYSLVQFHRFSIDGDLGNLAIPGLGYEQVFKDPFGFGAISSGVGHGGSNRFFSHVALKEYYANVPFWLQRFVSPLESIYLANALFKWFIHLSFIFLLVHYGRLLSGGIKQAIDWKWLLVLSMTTSLLQTHGNFRVMGIIDPATSYNFFYSFPLLILLLVLLPFLKPYLGDASSRRPKKGTITLAFLVGLSLCLSGPLVAPCILLIGSGCLLISIKRALKYRKLSLQLTDVYWILLMFFAVYAFYLGTYNIENPAAAMPLGKRYELLFTGLWRTLVKKPGFSTLLLLASGNFFVLKRYLPEQEGVRKAILFLAAFSIVYLLLLPLGGFRAYRPYFVRWDTLLPVTISVLLVFIASTLAILHSERFKSLLTKYQSYLLAIVTATIFYTAQDLYSPRNNDCERQAIEHINQSEEATVYLTEFDCFVMSWSNIDDPDQSYLNGQLLYRLGITQQPKKYYFSKAPD